MPKIYYIMLDIPNNMLEIINKFLEKNIESEIKDKHREKKIKMNIDPDSKSNKTRFMLTINCSEVILGNLVSPTRRHKIR